MLLEDAGIALRGLFLIDKAGVVRHQRVNDQQVGPGHGFPWRHSGSLRGLLPELGKGADLILTVGD